MFVVTLMNIPGWHSIHPEEIIEMNYKPIIGVFSTKLKALEIAINYNIKTFDLEEIFYLKDMRPSASDSIKNDNISTIYENIIKYIKEEKSIPQFIVRYAYVCEYMIDSEY